jgi:hypothetical protein
VHHFDIVDAKKIRPVHGDQLLERRSGMSCLSFAGFLSTHWILRNYIGRFQAR